MEKDEKELTSDGGMPQSHYEIDYYKWYKITNFIAWLSYRVVFWLVILNVTIRIVLCLLKRGFGIEFDPLMGNILKYVSVVSIVLFIICIIASSSLGKVVSEQKEHPKKRKLLNQTTINISNCHSVELNDIHDNGETNVTQIK